MSNADSPAPVHCYTNPSFCRQSEFIADPIEDLPPPPEFQIAQDLPPPPPQSIAPSIPIPIQNSLQSYQIRYGLANPAFQNRPDPDAIELNRSGTKFDRYCYVDENPQSIEPQEARILYDRNTKSRYEYIDDDLSSQPVTRLQRRASLSRFEMIAHRQNQQFMRQGSYHGPHYRATTKADDHENLQRIRRVRQNGNDIVRYALVPTDEGCLDVDSASLIGSERNSPQGRYARVPMQEDDPPLLPKRNICEQQELRENTFSSKNNLATQRLHAMLTTPRKRSRSEERNLSPGKEASRFTPPISAAASPTGRGVVPGSSRRSTPVGTPQRTFSPTRTPQTSTPNKENPSARRCLPLTEQQDLGNYGKTRCRSRHDTSLATSPIELSLRFGEPPPRYAFTESTSESMPMIIESPKYKTLSSPGQQIHKRDAYDTVESAFITRTAVVPPLSSPNSEENTTLASGTEKGERRNAPLLLILVGILTCGLALYLSWTQGRQYYLDSAAGCGICCALAGACRSLRRTWTGLGLAGLSALSCAGLLLLASKQPRAGTPLHDITAGALCGVSLLGAGLALLTLLAPRCHLSRHRRVHSWIPNFSP